MCAHSFEYSTFRLHTLHSAASGLPVSVYKELLSFGLINYHSPLLKSGKYHIRSFTPIFSQHPKFSLYAPSPAKKLLVVVCIMLWCFNAAKPPQNPKKDYF